MRRMRLIRAILVVVVGTLLSCLVGHAQLSETTPTYYRDVLPILRGHCEVCHRDAGIAPISFADYERAGRYAAAKFQLAAPRADRRSVHRRNVEGCGRPARSALDGQRHLVGVCAGKFAG